MSIDKFFTRRYDKETYHCAHFVVEVWKHLTGDDIEGSMSGALLPVKDKFISRSIRHKFKRIKKPSGLAIVLMRGAKEGPHVGIFYKNKVLDIVEGTGVRFTPLEYASVGFNKVSFYQCQTA